MMSLQRQAERRVYMLLHRVRFARELPDTPFSEAICRATGTSDAVRAFACVVEKAIPGDGASAAKMREAILGVDFANGSTNLDCARTMHVSKRHFQRLRAEAVGRIARYVEDNVGSAILTGSDAPPSARATLHRLDDADRTQHAQLRRLRVASELGVEIGRDAFANAPALAAGLVSAFVSYSREINGREPIEPRNDQRSYDALTRFELERIAFLRARDCGRAFEMKTISANLERLADGRRTAATAACCKAEALVRLGALDEAATVLDRLDVLLLEHGDAERRVAATVVRAQLALARGDLARADDLAKGALTVLDPRHREATRCLEIASAVRLARSQAWIVPEPHGDAAPCWYDRCVADVERARHLAVGDQRLATWLARRIYEIASSRGLEGIAARAAAALGWTARALAHVLRTQDVSLAAYLHVRRADPAAAVPVVHERLALIVPQLAADKAPARAAVGDLIAAVLAGDGAAALRAAARRVAGAESALARYGARAASGIEAALSLSVAALDARPMAPGMRDAVREILFSMSQCDGVEHLRLGDGSAADAAGLRVRSIPPRPVA